MENINEWVFAGPFICVVDVFGGFWEVVLFVGVVCHGGIF